jgi:hypothetical protein
VRNPRSTRVSASTAAGASAGAAICSGFVTGGVVVVVDGGTVVLGGVVADEVEVARGRAASSAPPFEQLPTASKAHTKNGNRPNRFTC